MTGLTWSCSVHGLACPDPKLVSKELQRFHKATDFIKTDEGESNTHVRFVVGTDLLDPDVILGVYEWLRSAVGLSDGHYTGNVLEVTCVVNFDLQRQKSGGKHV